VKGPKGELSEKIQKGTTVKQEGEEIIVTRINDEPLHRGNHGLMRTLIQNMVTGVTEGYEKKLEVNGVGFRIAMSGEDLKMNLGFSHEVIFHVPQGITVATEQNVITVSGISKQQVGQVAAEIRALKKPEPYKGKGIKYVGERIIRKSGKSGKE
jgi:large subunit ribosomal protein L6